jgi:hypothetical protein
MTTKERFSVVGVGRGDMSLSLFLLRLNPHLPPPLRFVDDALLRSSSSSSDELSGLEELPKPNHPRPFPFDAVVDFGAVSPPPTPISSGRGKS